jgi:hypothetical protein
MADLIRSAKSGSDWTTNELEAYNIRIVDKGEEEFFGKKANKLPSEIDSDLLTYEFTIGQDVPEETSEIISFLDLACSPEDNQESAVDDFARLLLETMGYRSKTRVIRTRHRIPLLISGVQSMAQTDVCIIRKNRNILLLLQENKRIENPKNPEPQVIAEAIAAFQENNRKMDANGLKPIDAMTFPCITMTGTYPIFYLVEVTKSLSRCIIGSQYPNEETLVFRHIPRISRRRSDGMKPLGDRKKVLQCFEAFKRFVDELEKILEIEVLDSL